MKTLKLNWANPDKPGENVYVLADNITHWFAARCPTGEVECEVETKEYGKMTHYKMVPATAIMVKQGHTIFVKENPEEIERMLAG